MRNSDCITDAILWGCCVSDWWIKLETVQVFIWHGHSPDHEAWVSAWACKHPHQHLFKLWRHLCVFRLQAFCYRYDFSFSAFVSLSNAVPHNILCVLTIKENKSHISNQQDCANSRQFSTTGQTSSKHSPQRQIELYSSLFLIWPAHAENLELLEYSDEEEGQHAI